MGVDVCISKIKKIASSFLTILLIISNHSFAQASSDLNFYPLHVGDTWLYVVEEKPLGKLDVTHRSIEVTIVGKETIDEKQYYLLSDGEIDCYRRIRIDSTEATIWEYKDGIDCLIDSLSMQDENAYFSNDCHGSVWFKGDISKIIFNDTKQVKKFHFTPPTLCQYCIQKDYEYAYGIGKISSHSIYPAPYGFEAGYKKDSLVYTKIDGVEYGTNPNLNFYPLHVGDFWIYNVKFDSDFDNQDSTYFAKTSVLGLDTIDSKVYYKIEDAFGERNLIRIDSLNATIWQYSNGNEILLDSLSCSKGDIWGESNNFECLNDSTINFFGEQRRIKEIRNQIIVSSGWGTKEFTFAANLGLIYFNRYEIDVVGATRSAELVYAKINGSEFGNPNYLNDGDIYLSLDTVYLFPDGFNEDFADTTWLINNSNEAILIDSIKVNHGYSYRMQVFFDDSTSTDFDLHNYIDLPISFSINSNDSVKIILSKPDLCPICDGSGLIEIFTDSLHFYSNSEKNPVLILAVEGDGTLDAENIDTENITFTLQQNYPNPFNPSTVIKYSIPANVKSEMSNVKIVVFDILGREVATLVNENQKAGNYEVTFNAKNLTSGIYFYRLQSGSFVESKKMILVK
jgi:hypothetical protein